jgi:hypothetical protein
MSHLSLETIARLVDEQPSALDNAHLESCSLCREELDAMRADIAALGVMPVLEPSPTAWAGIEQRLAAEGLLAAPRGRHTLLFGGTGSNGGAAVWLARAAAVAFIFLGGALVGRALPTAAPGTQPDLQARITNGAQDAAQPGTQGGTRQVAAASEDPKAAEDNEAPRVSDPLPSASTQAPVRVAATDPASESGSDALRTLQAAEDTYFSALTQYSEKAGTEVSDPNARLAALEGIVLTTRAALAQSPTDPVINGYHLTALAQRDAMLKQIKATPATSW